MRYSKSYIIYSLEEKRIRDEPTNAQLIRRGYISQPLNLHKSLCYLDDLFKYIWSSWFLDEIYTLKRSKERHLPFILCSFCARNRTGWLVFVISFNPNLENTRTQNKQEQHSSGLAFHKTVSEHSCFWRPELPLDNVFLLLPCCIQPTSWRGKLHSCCCLLNQGWGMRPVVESLRASVAHGRHGLPVTAATHTSSALVLTGSPGPPAPVESLLGISEKAQGCPIGTMDKPVPIRDCSALSPLRCWAPGCPCCTVLCRAGGGPRLFSSMSHPVAGLPSLGS